MHRSSALLPLPLRNRSPPTCSRAPLCLDFPHPARPSPSPRIWGPITNPFLTALPFFLDVCEALCERDNLKQVFETLLLRDRTARSSEPWDQELARIFSFLGVTKQFPEPFLTAQLILAHRWSAALYEGLHIFLEFTLCIPPKFPSTVSSHEVSFFSLELDENKAQESPSGSFLSLLHLGSHEPYIRPFLQKMGKLRSLRVGCYTTFVCFTIAPDTRSSVLSRVQRGGSTPGFRSPSVRSVS